MGTLPYCTYVYRYRSRPYRGLRFIELDIDARAVGGRLDGVAEAVRSTPDVSGL